jgi:TRAP transporter TAXI family solute receptor
MRAIFPMYDTPFQFAVLQESGIRSIAELAGKQVGVGPRLGTSAAYFPEFFNKLKVDANLVFGEWGELASQLHQRTIDALAVGAGVPVPSFIELEAKERIRYIAFDPDQISTLRLAMPELTPSRISAGAYPSLLRPYETLGLYNFAIAHAELPDDLVYNVVRAVFENHEEMLEATAAAAATVPANLDRNSFLPLHPGAIRYYRQIGKAGQAD